MQKLQGIAVSPGVAIGEALVMDTEGFRIPRRFVARDAVVDEMERLDKAIAAARQITDTASRIKAYQAIDQTIGAEMPDIPLMFYKHHHVVSSRVHGFVFSSMYLADLSKTWLSGK